MYPPPTVNPLVFDESPHPAPGTTKRTSMSVYAGTFVTSLPDWHVGDTFTTGDGRALRITEVVPVELIEVSNERPAYALWEVTAESMTATRRHFNEALARVLRAENAHFSVVWERASKAHNSHRSVRTVYTRAALPRDTGGKGGDMGYKV